MRAIRAAQDGVDGCAVTVTTTVSTAPAALVTSGGSSTVEMVSALPAASPGTTRDLKYAAARARHRDSIREKAAAAADTAAAAGGGSASGEGGGSAGSLPASFSAATNARETLDAVNLKRNGDTPWVPKRSAPAGADVSHDEEAQRLFKS